MEGERAMLRVFFAAEPPEALRRELAGLTDQLKGLLTGFRWSENSGYHLTLRFLGDVPETRTEEIAAVMTEVAGRFPPLTLWATSWGAFPSLRQPRVLWLGIGGDDESLPALQRLVGELVAVFPLEGELEQPFRPHVTVARSRFPRAVPADRLEGFPLPESFWRVQELLLIASTRTHRGACHRILARAPLGAMPTEG